MAYSSRVRHGPCVLWPIASLQVGSAVQYGPFCKGQQGPDTSPKSGATRLQPPWTTDCCDRGAGKVSRQIGASSRGSHSDTTHTLCKRR